MSEQKKIPKVQSLLVGFSIIDLVAKSPQPLKFNDIQHHTKVTKSNLSKYLYTLTTLGALHRDLETGLYSGGPALIEYGMATVNKENIIDKATPYLEEINLLSKETTLLAIWTHEGPMIIKMILSQAGLNLGGQLGTVLPIHSAGGKIFASFMAGPLIDEWISKETSHLTKEESALLQEELITIGENKITFASDALAPSIASTAIPIFNFNNHVLGAIIIVGFQKTIPTHPDEELSIHLLEKSKEISAIFGFSK